MSKSLALTDFRAVRKVLEPHEFASGGDDVPPTDLIDSDVWDGIMHLPDDVAISISNHHGTRLRLLHTLWGDWLEAIGPIDKPDELFNCMLDAADCFRCTTFDFLHGYYRSALANLRSALELVIVGLYGNCDPNNAEYLGWKDGTRELAFSRARKRMLDVFKGQPGSWLLDHDKFPAKTFRDLCRFTHSRLDASDFALWRSNGPVYNNAAIKLVFDTSLQVYVICYLLVKLGRPAFKLPKHSRILFELDWLQGHAEMVRAFRELGELSQQNRRPTPKISPLGSDLS
jgi:hypothetical protein